MIKKHINGNNYIVTKDGLWIRDFTKSDMPFIDINKLFSNNEFPLILNNENDNSLKKYQNIDIQNNNFENVIIVSDGYDFEKKHKILSNIPTNVCIIAVNGALAKWELVGEKCPRALRRAINYYLINNPFEDCVQFLPKKHNYYPNCISSYRTNPKFLKNYKGSINVYSPAENQQFISNIHSRKYKIDDYRNPICGAIGIAYRFGVKKLMLLCCDEVFSDNKNGTEKLENGLYQYPQQNICKNLIDGNLYWLKDIDIVSHSFINYENARYINEDKIAEWFL